MTYQFRVRNPIRDAEVVVSKISYREKQNGGVQSSGNATTLNAGKYSKIGQPDSEE